MRRLALLALLGLLAASVPASADVTVHERLPDDLYCDGTNSAYGHWGEAWVGSGRDDFGACYVHLFVDTPGVAEQQSAASARCVELEWDTGYTHYACWLQGQPECSLVAAGEEGPSGDRKNWVCLF